MAKKLSVLPLIAVGLAVVLIGIVAFDMLGGGIGGGDPFKRKSQLLADMHEKLLAAGQVKVTFHADHRHVLEKERIAWFGTSQIRWEPFQSATTFDKIQMDAARDLITAEQVVDGNAVYYRSPTWPTSDKRPWIKTATSERVITAQQQQEASGMGWPTPLADPNGGLPSLSYWLTMAGDIGYQAAANGIKDDMSDVPDAPNKYMLQCSAKNGPPCPPPFPAPLDRYFNSATQATWMFWLDDEGLPRQVEVEVRMAWDPNLPAKPGYNGTATFGTFILRNQWKLSDYGNTTPITVPPADQVTADKVVTPKLS